MFFYSNQHLILTTIRVHTQYNNNRLSAKAIKFIKTLLLTQQILCLNFYRATHGHILYITHSTKHERENQKKRRRPTKHKRTHTHTHNKLRWNTMENMDNFSPHIAHIAHQIIVTVQPFIKWKAATSFNQGEHQFSFISETQFFFGCRSLVKSRKIGN